MMSMNRNFRPQEAADQLGITRPYLSELVRAGKIKASGETEGGHRRYTPQDIAAARAYLDGEQVEGTQAKPAVPASQPGTLLNNPLINRGKQFLDENLSAEGKTQLKAVAGAGAILAGGLVPVVAGGYLLGSAVVEEEQQREQKMIDQGMSANQRQLANLRGKLTFFKIGMVLSLLAIPFAYLMSMIPVSDPQFEPMVANLSMFAMLIACAGFGLATMSVVQVTGKIKHVQRLVSQEAQTATES